MKLLLATATLVAFFVAILLGVEFGLGFILITNAVVVFFTKREEVIKARIEVKTQTIDNSAEMMTRMSNITAEIWREYHCLATTWEDPSGMYVGILSQTQKGIPLYRLEDGKIVELYQQMAIPSEDIEGLPLVATLSRLPDDRTNTRRIGRYNTDDSYPHVTQRDWLQVER